MGNTGAERLSTKYGHFSRTEERKVLLHKERKVLFLFKEKVQECQGQRMQTQQGKFSRTTAGRETKFYELEEKKTSVTTTWPLGHRAMPLKL